MSHKTKVVIFLILFLLWPLTFSSNSAYATAVADFSGIIDWNSFTVDPGSMTLDWNSRCNHTYYWGQAQGGSPQTGDDNRSGLDAWDYDNAVSGVFGDVYGSIEWLGETNSDEIIGHAIASANGSIDNYIQSKGERGGTFTLTGADTLHAEVNYSFEYYLETTLAGDSASGQAFLQLFMLDWTRYQAGEAQYWWSDYVVPSYSLSAPNTASNQNSGTLSLDISFDGVEPHYIEFYLSALPVAMASSPEGAPAPVPEPATMLLLGSGLAGLAGFRKRFRRS